MTDQSDVACGRALVERWCVLAEQRLDYLTELYESGRWRRYHTELDFLENVQEAKRAVNNWRGLLHSEAGPDNRPIDLSWLGRKPMQGPQPAVLLADEPALPRTIELPAEDAPPIAPVDALAVDVAAAGPERPVWDSIDVSLMQQRYPLLRPSL